MLKMNENLRNNVYYDALGRKTQAEPSTRRYLFDAPRKSISKNKQKDWQLGTISFILRTTIDGYVNAWHNYAAPPYPIEEPENCDCSTSIEGTENCDCLTNLKISFTFETTILDIVHQNNPLLIAHENKHVEIYNELGNATWEKIIQLNYCDHTFESACSMYKQEVKSEFENKLTILINAQNKWDDEDKNNVSHNRVNLQEKLNEMYQIVNNYACPDMR